MPLSSPILDFLAPTSPSRSKPRPASEAAMGKALPSHHPSTRSARQQHQSTSSSSSFSSSSSSSSSSSFSPHGMLSGSPFSSGQSNSSSQALASTFGSTQDNPIILSPDLSPVLPAAAVSLSRPPSPLNLLSMPDEAAGRGRPSETAGSSVTRSSGDGAGRNDDEASGANMAEMPTGQALLPEHGARSSTTATISRQLQAPAAGESSFEGVAESPQGPMSRFAQSFPAYHPPQEADGRGIDAQRGQSSTSTLAQRAQAPSDDSASSSTFASARQSQGASDDDGSEPRPTASILTTRAGMPLWVEADNNLLCSIIQRRGLSWRQIVLDFNEKSSSPRSSKGLQHQWFKLTHRPVRSPQTIAAMETVVNSSLVHGQRPNTWTEEELDAVRSSLAQRQSKRSAYTDFQAKFTPSKRSWDSFQWKFKQMARAAREAGAQVQGQSEEEDVEECEDDSDPNELLSEESDDDEADADVSMAASSTSAGTRKLGWSERDDRWLKLSVAQHRRGNRIDWTSLVPSFNSASETRRSQSAIQTRWYTVLAGDTRPAASSSASLKRKRMQRPSTPAPRPPRLRWTGQEHSVLRQILARYPDYASSHLKVCEEFKKALPRSQRSSVALLKKCRRLVDKNGGRDVEEGSEEVEDETDEEDGDETGDVARREISVVIPAPPRGTMRTRSGRRLLPLHGTDSEDQDDEDQMDDSFIQSSCATTGADTSQPPSQQVTAPTPAAEAQQLQPTSSTSTTTPAATAATNSSAAAAAPSASAFRAAPISTSSSSVLAAAPAVTLAAAPASIQIPSNFTFSTSPKGVRINGCFPGLEVVVFAGGHAQFFPHASTVPASFDQPPLLHLRCLDEGSVEPVRLSQGVAFRTKPVMRRGGGAAGGSVVRSGGGGGVAGEMVVQTTFDVGDEFSVVLV